MVTTAWMVWVSGFMGELLSEHLHFCDAGHSICIHSQHNKNRENGSIPPSHALLSKSPPFRLHTSMCSLFFAQGWAYAVEHMDVRERRLLRSSPPISHLSS